MDLIIFWMVINDNCIIVGLLKERYVIVYQIDAMSGLRVEIFDIVNQRDVFASVGDLQEIKDFSDIGWGSCTESPTQYHVHWWSSRPIQMVTLFISVFSGIE